MKIKRVLVLYKKSVYANYFLAKKSSLRYRFKSIPEEHKERLVEVHRQHYQTLKLVEECLKASNLSFQKSTRGRQVDYGAYDLIITVGGDGTFLEAARNIKHQLILGVNSSPQWSVGNFCTATAKTFPRILENVLRGHVRIQLLHRLRIKGIPELRNVNILNDVLVAHGNPAAISRYGLQIGSRKEEQRSSGIWISTAVGSTGAIRSAGGKVITPESDKFQFLCRELYNVRDRKYRLRRGVLSVRQKIQVTSFMRGGVIFLDGARLSAPFPFGTTMTVAHSPVGLRTIRLGDIL